MCGVENVFVKLHGRNVKDIYNHDLSSFKAFFNHT